MYWLCVLHTSHYILSLFLFSFSSELCLNRLLQFDNKFLDIEELCIIDYIELLLQFYSEVTLDCLLNFTQLL